MSTITGNNSRTLYDAWHNELDVDAQADAPWHRLVKHHIDPARDLAATRVLEIGCGRGGFSCWLARVPSPPRQIVAADFSEAAIMRARSYAERNHIEGISWCLADIQCLAFPDEAFDTVISCETVEHVPMPARAVRELARVLKPAGRLFLTTPNYMGTLGLYRFYLWLRGRRFTECGQPINNFTWLPRTRGWLGSAGLKVQKTDAVGHYLPFPRRPPIELSFLNNPRLLMKWLGHHSLLIAAKT